MPVLWHLKPSPFNEKARWALDHKRVAHRRRAGIPGRNAKVARRLGAGETFPVLLLDGRAYGDSTWIVATLERKFADRPLYPDDPALRRRALELEDRFTDDLGPAVRIAIFDSVLVDPELTVEMFFGDASPRRRALLRGPAWPLIKRAFIGRVGLDMQAVQRAYDTITAVGEEIRGAGPYLAGDGFTVADLTLAAMTAPAVAPVEFPYRQPQRGHPAFARLREHLAAAGLEDRTLELYARHRGESAEVSR